MSDDEVAEVTRWVVTRLGTVSLLVVHVIRSLLAHFGDFSGDELAEVP